MLYMNTGSSTVTNSSLIGLEIMQQLCILLKTCSHSFVVTAIIWASVYLAMCGTDRESNIGRQHNSDRWSQLNCKSTAGRATKDHFIQSYLFWEQYHQCMHSPGVHAFRKKWLILFMHTKRRKYHANHERDAISLMYLYTWIVELTHYLCVKMGDLHVFNKILFCPTHTCMHTFTYINRWRYKIMPCSYCS